MEITDIYLKSQIHKVISQDKSRGMLSHAYMIECSDEYLLSNYEINVAKVIFCDSLHVPCGQCNNCNKVEHGNKVDLKIFPKDNKSIVVDDINEVVSDSIQRPMDGAYKVYILRNFDQATVQAQNKLLKTLEEAPNNVIFILSCTNASAILPTITSRVKKVTENLLSIDSVAEFLKDKNIINSDSLASISGGSISTAMKLVGGDAGKIIDLVFNILINLRTSSDILRYSSQIIALKKDLPLFVDTIIAVLRDVIVFKEKFNINFKGREAKLKELEKILSSDACYKIMNVAGQIYNKLEFNCNPTGVVDKLLLDILEVKFLCQ